MITGIKVYLRNVKRAKASFVINLVGLSSGLACAFLIFLWVTDEVRVDKFHSNDDRLYQIRTWIRQSSGDAQIGEDMSAPMAEELAKNIAGVQNGIAIVHAIKMNGISAGKKAFKSEGIYVSPDFFNVFSFELIAGSAKSVFRNEGNIAISEKLALMLFGSVNDAIGKYVEHDKRDQFVVAGVFKDVGDNSTIKFDYVLSLNVFNKHGGEIKWGLSNAKIYLLLNEGSNVDDFNSLLLKWLKDLGEDPERTKVYARQFSKGYLYGNGFESGGRIDYLMLFSGIGIIILLIACINFISLSTAMASMRMKEVGVKRTVGASRNSIIWQHVRESIMLAFIALVFAVLVVLLWLPSFNEVAGKEIALTLSADTVLAFLSITLLTGFLAGIYPAWYISRFQPGMIIKGMANSLEGQWIRKGLVVTQFTVSAILMLTTLVVYSQFKMIQNRNLGYNKDHIIFFDADEHGVTQRETFLEELSRVPGVINVSSMLTLNNIGFFGIQESTSIVDWPGRDSEAKTTMICQRMDYGMIELMGIKVKEGRTFSKEYTGDLPGIIFNEAAIKVMDLKGDAVGTKVKVWQQDYEIIGVVNDFYFESIHAGSVKPLFIVRDSELLNTIVVKTSGENLQNTISAIEKVHQKFSWDYPFIFRFLDQDFQNLYAIERRMSVLSRYFSMLAILISCLGLFGLTAFTVDRRKKEISMRMVFGSTTAEVLLLLFKDVSKLVVISLVIGFPIGYVLMNNWLSGFSIRIDLEPWFFIVAGLISFALMLIAAGVQILKVLSINPAESLRNE